MFRPLNSVHEAYLVTIQCNHTSEITFIWMKLIGYLYHYGEALPPSYVFREALE